MPRQHSVLARPASLAASRSQQASLTWSRRGIDCSQGELYRQAARIATGLVAIQYLVRGRTIAVDGAALSHCSASSSLSSSLHGWWSLHSNESTGIEHSLLSGKLGETHQTTNLFVHHIAEWQLGETHTRPLTTSQVFVCEEPQAPRARQRRYLTQLR